MIPTIVRMFLVVEIYGFILIIDFIIPIRLCVRSFKEMGFPKIRALRWN
jgi:hypothetical protein